MAGRSALSALKSIPGNAVEKAKNPVEVLSTIPRDLQTMRKLPMALLKAGAGKVDDSISRARKHGRRRN